MFQFHIAHITTHISFQYPVKTLLHKKSAPGTVYLVLRALLDAVALKIKYKR